MKYIVLALCGLSIAIAGCGGSSAHNLATNPEAKKDVAKAEKIVKDCLAKNHSRKAIISCIAPPGHERALEDCAKGVFIKDVPLHKKKVIPDLAVCVERNR